MTKITIETQYGTVTVETQHDDLDISDMLFLVVKPALLATGYDEKTVDEALGRG